MIRLIIQTTDHGAAVHVGGPVSSSVRTFDIDGGAAEAFLREFAEMLPELRQYSLRQVIGVELLPPKAAEAEAAR